MPCLHTDLVVRNSARLCLGCSRHLALRANITVEFPPILEVPASVRIQGDRSFYTANQLELSARTNLLPVEKLACCLLSAHNTDILYFALVAGNCCPVNTSILMAHSILFWSCWGSHLAVLGGACGAGLNSRFLAVHYPLQPIELHLVPSVVWGLKPHQMVLKANSRLCAQG